ncbi:phenol hydroxylase subunit [Oceanobacter mangrovi]|uniref:phenol hydroxylase subunit n=1 Tax=Oceanobacter mangrovi TaxID=2862510 RepID=UPI001C8EEE9B|nr:phenol hydroxylase subunit [Oceanobacter mangrovi]
MSKRSQPQLEVVSSRDTLPSMTKYIRVRSEPDARYVEFDFAIGSPELFVELIMPCSAFEAFCNVNSVVPMSAEQIAVIDAEMEKWRYGEDTLAGRSLSR